MLILTETIFDYFTEMDAARAKDPGMTRTIRRAPLDYLQGVDFEDTAAESLLSYEKYTETFQLYLEYQDFFKAIMFERASTCALMHKEMRLYVSKSEGNCGVEISDALYQHLDLKGNQNRKIGFHVDVKEFLGHMQELTGREFLRDVSDYLKYTLLEIVARNREYYFAKTDAPDSIYMYRFPFLEEVKHRCIFKDFKTQYNAAIDGNRRTATIEKAYQIALSKMQPVTLNGYNLLNFKSLKPEVTEAKPPASKEGYSKHWSDTYFDIVYRTIRCIQKTITGRVTSRLEW